MTTFEWIIALLLSAVMLSALARRIKVPYPTLLAIAGVLLAFLPSGPAWPFDPDLTLALFVAPVLVDAAYDTSWRDLRNNWLPISTLAIVAVGVTTAAVAWVAHWLVPEMPWSSAIALGAIVAPPDAAAATAILRQVNLPYRILKILEGESLLNDASALLIYRISVGAAATHHFAWSTFGPTVLLALAGSVVAGYLCAKIWLKLTERVTDVSSAIILQFGGTFLVWIAAGHLGLSSILTLVVFAIVLGRVAPTLIPARIRIPTNAVWETVVFILNVLAFMLIGLQLRPIWNRLDDVVRLHDAEIAGLVLLTIILARLFWVMLYRIIIRYLIWQRLAQPSSVFGVPTFKGGLVIGWCGMRGIVTLATAFALPETFPYRDLILLVACATVLGTLIIQGFSLGPLVGTLGLKDDNPVAIEVARARGVAYRAALVAIDGESGGQAELLRMEYRELLQQADTHPEGGITTTELPADPLRRQAIDAARRALLGLRRSEDIGDDAFHLLEEEFDRAELGARG